MTYCSLKKAFANPLLAFMLVKYIVYVLQFVSSLLIANKLGPYYFGIWGFILLLINLFNVFNFGISNAINILLVQYKNNIDDVRNFVTTSFLLIGVICSLVGGLYLYHLYLGIPGLFKFEAEELFWVVALIAVFSYINNLLVAIYRARNSLFEVAIFQSTIQVFIFISIFMSNGQQLIYLLLGSYIIGHFLSFLFFYFGSALPRGGSVTLLTVRLIYSKAFFLFGYNLFFYGLFVSTRIMVSYLFSVEEFGMFMFSFTLGNAILMLLEAVSFVLFPKIIDKLKSNIDDHSKRVIKKIRKNYITLAHFLMYIALALFPLLLELTPQYKSALLAINLMILSIVFKVNSYGYDTFLLAQNKEKILLLISLLSLIVNISVGLFLYFVVGVSYEYMILATLLAYSIQSLANIIISNKFLSLKNQQRNISSEFFPINLFVPYFVALLLALYNEGYQYVGLCVFLTLNIRGLKEIYKTIHTLAFNPNSIRT